MVTFGTATETKQFYPTIWKQQVVFSFFPSSVSCPPSLPLSLSMKTCNMQSNYILYVQFILARSNLNLILLFFFFILRAGKSPCLNPSLEAEKSKAAGILFPSQLNLVVCVVFSSLAFWFCFLYVKPGWSLAPDTLPPTPNPRPTPLEPPMVTGKSRGFQWQPEWIQKHHRLCGEKLDGHQFGVEAMRLWYFYSQFLSLSLCTSHHIALFYTGSIPQLKLHCPTFWTGKHTRRPTFSSFSFAGKLMVHQCL